MNKVMVFTPVAEPGVKALEPETVQAIFALEWDGIISYLFQRDNPYGDDGRRNILHQYQVARAAFLAGDAEAMLVIECDIIPPRDTLQRLAAANADCAYGVYRYRGQYEIINVYERYPGRPRNEGESLSIHPAKLAAARKADVILCSGGGLGCALIKRHVLEAIDFRLGETGHCDTYFNLDVMHNGFVQKAIMSILCGHKREDGRIFIPFEKAYSNNVS